MTRVGVVLFVVACVFIINVVSESSSDTKTTKTKSTHSRHHHHHHKHKNEDGEAENEINHKTDSSSENDGHKPSNEKTLDDEDANRHTSHKRPHRKSQQLSNLYNTKDLSDEKNSDENSITNSRTHRRKGDQGHDSEDESHTKPKGSRSGNDNEDNTHDDRRHRGKEKEHNNQVEETSFSGKGSRSRDTSRTYDKRYGNRSYKGNRNSRRRPYKTERTNYDDDDCEDCNEERSSEVESKNPGSKWSDCKNCKRGDSCYYKCKKYHTREYNRGYGKKTWRSNKYRHYSRSPKRSSRNKFGSYSRRKYHRDSKSSPLNYLKQVKNLYKTLTSD